jgi:hypothetical protein
MYKLIAVLIIFLLGFYFISQSNKLETFEDREDKEKCPDVLIQKGSALFLYNSKRVDVPGVNPIKFENLDEYVEFAQWQRNQGILCPILFLQHAYDAQGEPVYKARPSPTNLQGGLPDFLANRYEINPNLVPPPMTRASVGLDMMSVMGPNDNIGMPRIAGPGYDSTGPIDSETTYPAFDAHGQFIGLDTPLDKMFHESAGGVSPNPMDTNWGGAAYTQTLIDSGYYKDNEVQIKIA